MVTLKMSYTEYLAAQVQQKMSVAEKLNRLTAGTSQLDRRTWTDQELRAIPTELVQFAYEHSAGLRKEFLQEATFRAYWKELQSNT